jgi:hypothetical protein
VKIGPSSAAFLLCALQCASGGEAESSTRADTLIAASKEASGDSVWNRAVLWHETGRVSAGGLSGQYEVWASLRSLHNARYPEATAGTVPKPGPRTPAERCGSRPVVNQ